MIIYLVYEDLGHTDVVVGAYKSRESAATFIKNMESKGYWIDDIELED